MTSACEREKRKSNSRGTSATRSSKMAACWLHTHKPEARDVNGSNTRYSFMAAVPPPHLSGSSLMPAVHRM